MKFFKNISLIFTNFISNKFKASISKDYFNFAAIMIITSIGSSGYLVWHDMQNQKQNLYKTLVLEAEIVSKNLSDYFNYVSHIIEDKAHKISIKGENNIKNIELIFKRRFLFPKTKDGFKKRVFRWPHFSWVNKHGYKIIESQFGILQKPYKIDNSQYLYLSTLEHWKLHLSDPYYSQEEEKFFIDAALGVTNFNGEKYIGSITTKFEVDKIIKNINQHIDIKHDIPHNVNFMILNKDYRIIMDSNLSTLLNTESSFLPDSNLLQNIANNSTIILSEDLKYNNNIYKAAISLSNYPFTILTGYNPYIQNKELITNIATRILQITGTTIFILILLFIYQKRMIRPIIYLSNISKELGKGNLNVQIRQLKHKNANHYPIEIYELENSLILTKKYLLKEQENRQKAEFNEKILTKNNILLKQVKNTLEQKQEVAKKSKDIRDKFLQEVRHKTVEESINLIINDITILIEHYDGNININANHKRESLDNILNICAKILTFTSDELNLKEENIADIVIESISIQEEDAQIKNIKIINNIISDNIKHSLLDRLKIRQVITGLIFYSMQDINKNNKENHIKISNKNISENGEDFIILIIEDNSHGVSEDERLLIDESFAQRGISKNSNGTELPLIAIRHLLALHRAKLQIISKRGTGNIIKIILPVITKNNENNFHKNNNENIITFPQKI